MTTAFGSALVSIVARPASAQENVDVQILNPVLTPVVDEANASLTDPLAVANLAAMLEEVAGDTYLANLALLADQARDPQGGAV